MTNANEPEERKRNQSRLSTLSDADKRASVANYKIGEQCGPDNRDGIAKPKIDKAVAASYPTGNDAPYPYTHEPPGNAPKVRLMFADGKHPDDRWDLTNAQIGAGTVHEHDDWKRSPPEILDQDPTSARAGYLSNYRVPSQRAVY